MDELALAIAQQGKGQLFSTTGPGSAVMGQNQSVSREDHRLLTSS